MAAITPGHGRIYHTRLAPTKRGALGGRLVGTVCCEGVSASAVPEPLESGHTPVRSRKQATYTPSRRGLREASAEARLPTCRQASRCRHERGRAMLSRVTRACRAASRGTKRSSQPETREEAQHCQGRDPVGPCCTPVRMRPRPDVSLLPLKTCRDNSTLP